ncbi:hypothetical protein FRC11_014789 [Ceratobasidium sp. 423]|nr:hypothetical protein FRC11_014789 [Ceratobasidium sp. 423]
MGQNVTYVPPALPVHVSANLEPISGAPSEEQVLKVQNAIRSYQKLTDLPSLFDSQVNAELSQHLFDIQMARYIQRCRQASPVPRGNVLVELANPVYPPERTSGKTNSATNNPGRGADVAESHQSTRSELDASIRDVVERSNQLVERSNQLMERSNQIAEQLTQVVERSNQPMEQPNNFTEKFNELFGRLNEHLEKSNLLAEASTKPVEKLGDVLGNINRVLMKIQHAIIRSHKGNELSALDCLVNEKGDVHAVNKQSSKPQIERWEGVSRQEEALLDSQPVALQTAQSEGGHYRMM